MATDWFGYTPPDERAAYGARAIYSSFVSARRKVEFIIDVVHDRQQVRGTAHERQELVAFMRKAIVELRKVCDREFLMPSDNREVEYRADGFVLRANPRRSFGYLYIGAWKE